MLVLALISGGLDPAPALKPLLQAAVMGAVCASVLSLGLAILVLIRGPRRVVAGLGFVLSALLVLEFTGLGFAFVR